MRRPSWKSSFLSAKKLVCVAPSGEPAERGDPKFFAKLGRSRTSGKEEYEPLANEAVGRLDRSGSGGEEPSTRKVLDELPVLIPKAPFNVGFSLFKEETEDFLLLVSSDVISWGCESDLSIGAVPTVASGEGG
jgi:hypothetical protein